MCVCERERERGGTFATKLGYREGTSAFVAKDKKAVFYSYP